MSFPPRDIITELFVGGGWTDISGDRRERRAVEISRGRKDEGSKPEPSYCELLLDNRSGDYSPRNPLGPWYGDIGRNTPIRVSLGLAKDTFARTVVNEWGAAETGQDYTLLGAGGSVLFSDWQVASGVGTMSVPVANGNRRAKLLDLGFRDVDVAATFSLPITDVTGGNLDAGITLREQASTEHYYVKLEITTAEAVLIVIRHSATGDLLSATVPGLTHTSSQALRIRAQIEGQTIRGKVWPASGKEPYGWHITLHDERIKVAGVVGVRCGASSANTNTKPIVWSVDNLVVRSPRFAGEVASLKQRWDLSDSDIYTDVEAAGIMRRLGQGSAPLQSTLYRGLTTLATPPVAYWPAEDSAGSTSIASATPGVGAMYVAGPTQFGEYDEIASSKPLPVVKAASWVGSIPPYVSTGKVQLRFLMHVPAGQIADDEVICDVHTFRAGTNLKWEVKYRTGGDLSLEVWPTSGTQIFDSGAIDFNIDDKNVLVSLELEQDGADVDWRLAALEIGQSLGSQFTGTVTGQTLNSAVRVTVAPYSTIGDTTIGHINVRKEITITFDLAPELRAFAGETALTRIQRLCSQNSVPFSFVSDPDIDSARMGPQRPRTLLTLLQECADADLGTLFESRGELGIAYRERSSLYNQPEAMTLNYAEAQVSAPFLPEDDDQLTRNDVTASREGGSSARVEVTTGRLSVADAADGGVGRYDEEVTVNVFTDEQLPDIAGWLTHLGATDETRYPTVRVNHASPGVRNDAELSRQLLDLDIDDRFVIANPRDNPDDISQLARGYTEQIRSLEHSIDINAAPESPYQVLTFDGADSRYDSDGSDLTADISDSATSFQVDVPSGPLWTTDAADMPIRFRIAGEEISVGAISGVSSPQTFSSVTRSVNAVVKEHDAGTPIELITLVAAL